MRKLIPIARRSEQGVALFATLILMTLLAAIGGSGTILSRADLFVSQNLLSGVQALWLAQAGAEVGKNWLENNLPGAAFPIAIGPETLGAGIYTVQIEDLDDGQYRITAVGQGHDASRRVVEEVVHIPQFTPLGVVTSIGDGLHPDFTHAASSPAGSGHRIPDFSIDGRNHAADGTLSPLCPDIAPFAVSQVEAQTDLINAFNSLKQKIVSRANRVCHTDGSSTPFGFCTPGLAWVRGPAPLPRFIEDPCAVQETACFLGLDLSASVLRATAQPAHVHLPEAPEDRGPFTPSSLGSMGSMPVPFARWLATAERLQLQTAFADMQQRLGEFPAEQVLHIEKNIRTGSHTFGTADQPRITQVEKGNGPLTFTGGSVVSGAGILVIPRIVRLQNVTLYWQGIIVLLNAGDLQVTGPNVCGHIIGVIVIQDDSVSDRKLDFDRVTRSSTCAPLSVNYSCEAVLRALTLLQRTLSWTEQFDA